MTQGGRTRLNLAYSFCIEAPGGLKIVKGMCSRTVSATSTAPAVVVLLAQRLASLDHAHGLELIGFHLARPLLRRRRRLRRFSRALELIAIWCGLHRWWPPLQVTLLRGVSKGFPCRPSTTNGTNHYAPRQEVVTVQPKEDASSVIHCRPQRCGPCNPKGHRSSQSCQPNP